MDDEVLAKALDGDDDALNRLAQFAELKLRPVAGALVGRFLGSDDLDVAGACEWFVGRYRMRNDTPT